MLDKTIEPVYSSNSPESGIFPTLKNIYRDREKIYSLLGRDLKSRYRRSVLGLFWTLLNPLLFSLILWVVFVSIFKSELANGTQFAPYLLAGVLLINFFNQGVLQAAESLSNGGGLFLKIRVDPIFVLFANTLSNLVNFLFGLFALVIVSLISKSKISYEFPLILFLALMLTLLITGTGLLLANFFVRFNDLKYIVTVALQILTYLTPIFYPKEMLGDKVRIIVNLNPLTSYLDIFRKLSNGTEIATNTDWFYMVISSLLIFLLGFTVFRKTWKSTVVMM
jgi:ABC-2 type transport system permease protein/lipopolysaccharide transport system permease protein